MRIRFWGVQGSIPTPLATVHLQAKIKEILRRARDHTFADEAALQNFLDELPFPLAHTTGGNTTCFEVVSANGQRLIVDLGTGARELGLALMKGPAGAGQARIPVLLTHCHWDHVMGFPFFMPAYTAGNVISFYGGHDYLEEALRRQGHPQSFPVPLEKMGATFEFHQVREEQSFRIHDFEVACKRLDHPGFSYAYRITEAGKSLVIATDAEYKKLDEESLRPFINFYRDAEVLVFDAQYSLKDLFQKIDWGHSSSFIGVDLCLLANVATLVLTHHDPSYSDDKMTEILDRTEAFKLETLKQNWPHKQPAALRVLMGYEGLELAV